MKHLVILLGTLASAFFCCAEDHALVISADQTRPLRVRQTVLPVFPRSVLEQGVMEGRARVVIDVDEVGRLTDWLVVGHTRPEFGTAAVGAIRAWEFEPMLLQGRPVASQVTIAFQFEARGVVIDIRPGTIVAPYLFGGLLDQVYRPRSERELDRIPFLLNPVEPAYTAELRDAGVTGSATVEFYIDETGAVRMPAIVSADFPELGDLAVQAVRQWTFEPPTSRGKRVLAHVRQRFDFARSAEQEAF